MHQNTTRIIYNNLIKDNNDKCSICIDSLGSINDCRALECSHMFHTKCIAEWTNNNKTCPICKESVLDNHDIPTMISLSNFIIDNIDYIRISHDYEILENDENGTISEFKSSSLLIYLAYHDNLDILKLLLENTEDNGDINFILVHAIKNNSVNFVEYLFEFYEDIIEDIDPDLIDRVIHDAVIDDSIINMIKLIIKYNSINDTQVRNIISLDNIELIEALVHIIICDSYSNCNDDNPNVFESIIKYAKMDLLDQIMKDAKYIYSWNIIFITAVKTNKIKIVKFLLKDNYSTYTMINYNEALVCAVNNHNKYITNILLNNGADIHYLDDAALICTVSKKCTGCELCDDEYDEDDENEDDEKLCEMTESLIKNLIGRGANVYAQQYEILYISVLYNTPYITKFLVKLMNLTNFKKDDLQFIKDKIMDMSMSTDNVDQFMYITEELFPADIAFHALLMKASEYKCTNVFNYILRCHSYEEYDDLINVLKFALTSNNEEIAICIFKQCHISFWKDTSDKHIILHNVILTNNSKIINTALSHGINMNIYKNTILRAIKDLNKMSKYLNRSSVNILKMRNIDIGYEMLVNKTM